MDMSKKQILPEMINVHEKHRITRKPAGMMKRNTPNVAADMRESRFRFDFNTSDAGLYVINSSNAAMPNTATSAVKPKRIAPKIYGAIHMAHAPCSLGIRYLRVFDLNEKFTLSFRFRAINFVL